MPSNPILICARDTVLRDELDSALIAAGYATSLVGSPADAVAAMRHAHFDLIVAEGLAASGAIASLRTAGSDGVTPILVVAPADDVEARIAFFEAGADDVIVGGFAPNELEGRVMAQLIHAGRVRPEDAPTSGTAEIISFFSPKGGVGTTTLAVNIAVLLAGGGGPARGHGAAESVAVPASHVLLIDMDLQFGQVATHLNLAPRYDLFALASDEQALNDPDLARSFLTPHPSGLMVLAAPPRPEADFRITLDQLQRIVEIVRLSFDYVLIDLGSRLDPRALWLLEQSHAHVFVLFPEVGALRAMSLLLAFLNETTPLQARSSIVLNHVFPRQLLKARDVEHLLRVRPAAEIPYTDVEMIRSVNEGIPLVVGRPASPGALAMRHLARAITGADQRATPGRAQPRRGLFGRR